MAHLLLCSISQSCPIEVGLDVDVGVGVGEGVSVGVYTAGMRIYGMTALAFLTWPSVLAVDTFLACLALRGSHADVLPLCSAYSCRR